MRVARQDCKHESVVNRRNERLRWSDDQAGRQKMDRTNLPKAFATRGIDDTITHGYLMR